MTMTNTDYPPPQHLAPRLQRVFAYWQSLKRGGNDIPFSDDVTFSAMRDLAQDALLITAFETPLRFRFDLIGANVAKRSGMEILGKFADEVELGAPLDSIAAQCLAAVKKRAPTYYRHEKAGPGSRTYRRLVLPLWGNGRVDMLLAAVADAEK